jgi:hypothetical protein
MAFSSIDAPEKEGPPQGSAPAADHRHPIRVIVSLETAHPPSKLSRPGVVFFPRFDLTPS